MWYRRIHRWAGLTALVIVLLLSGTGIALNHASAWRLDDRYVRWAWLLDAYDIDAPAPSASFAAGAHRATLLGTRLYLDGRELARQVESLAGLVATRDFVAVTTDREVIVLTPQGQLVERIAAGASMTPMAAVGTAADRVVVRSGDALFRFDETLLHPEHWPAGDAREVRWSVRSEVPAARLEELAALYRGRGLTVGRLLADLHSGRILAQVGPLVMDAAGIALLALSVTGLLMWARGGNGGRRQRPGP